MNLEMRGLGSCQKKQTIDEMREALVLFQTGCENLSILFGRERASETHFRFTHQVADWRAELMRDVGAESRESLKLVFQSFELPIKLCRQFSHCTWTGLCANPLT